MASLTPAQTAQVASWVAAGATLSQVQTRLAAELGVTMTFIDVRFLVDDLNLTLIEKEEPKTPEEPAAAEATDAPEVADEPAAEEPAAEEPAAEEPVAEEPAVEEPAAEEPAAEEPSAPDEAENKGDAAVTEQ